MNRLSGLKKLVLAAFIVLSTLLVMGATFGGIKLFTMLHNQAQTPTPQPDLAILGFPIAGNLAPDFKLTNQFGQSVTFSSLRGREVVLTFIDSKCIDVCPLTAEILLDARTQLGFSVANRIALVAINANPTATSVADIRDWSIKHGMLHQWVFLTGTAQQLESVYHQYYIYVQVIGKRLVHDSATLIIDSTGHQRLYFETLDSKNPSDLRNEERGLVAGMHQWLPAPQQ